MLQQRLKNPVFDPNGIDGFFVRVPSAVRAFNRRKSALTVTLGPTRSCFEPMLAAEADGP